MHEEKIEKMSSFCILNGSIGFIDFENVGFALKIKSKDLTFPWWPFLNLEINFINKWFIYS